MYGLITRYFFSHGPEDGFDGKAAQVPMAVANTVNTRENSYFAMDYLKHLATSRAQSRLELINIFCNNTASQLLNIR
jgi:hypothetical protein